ncbi:hypothetical protein [uncultured Clostridium sp.]|uniref:hypothetical protein n=1 Tax=uncultured Clostridium sp. TaxID=59620 RepID=UPI002608D5D2|nr:hypothetical protein [uncultured Clostridium sp.]
MTSDELYAFFKSMENIERNKFLDKIYEEYFNTGIPREQVEKDIKILEAYYNGELIEVEDEY